MNKLLLTIAIGLLLSVSSFSQTNQTQTFTDGFENIQSGNLRNYICWDGSSTQIQVRTGGAYEGNSYAQAKSGETISSQNYNFEVGKSYTISFYSKKISTTGSITLSTNGIAGTFSNPPTFNITGTGWVNYTTTFIPTVSGNSNFILTFNSNGNTYDIMIDNLVATVPSTSVPSTWVSCGNGVVLPVKFVSFNGNKLNDCVVLKWVVATEINNDVFVIERSTDCINFNTIGYVDGSGNSGYGEYTYNDYNLSNEFYYYRIKQVDYDNKYTYTNMICVGTDYIQEDVKIYDLQGMFIFEGKLIDFYNTKYIAGRAYIIFTPTKSYKIITN